MNAKRTVIESTAVPLRGNDIDTDRIIPARFLKAVTFDGLGSNVFADDRAQARQRSELHALDDPRFSKAEILIVNANFGCGSSREHAPQAIARRGVRAVVGESFAEIFFGNSLSIGLPCVTAGPDAVRDIMAACEAAPATTIRIDLLTRQIAVGSKAYDCAIPEGARLQLIEGRWDSTAELLSDRAAIDGLARRLPYVRGFESMP